MFYVVGGYPVSNVTREYNPATNTWTGKAVMPTARRDLTAAAPGNGKLYAIGGNDGTNNLNTNEEYSPTTNTWVTKTGMSTARTYPDSAALNGRIYVFSGSGGTGKENEEYDPATDTWSVKSAIPTARTYPAAVAINNKIYVLGSNGSGVNEEYSPNFVTAPLTGVVTWPDGQSRGVLSGAAYPPTASGSATFIGN